MAMKLPREIDYVGAKPSSLPNGTSCISTVVVPSNGSSFGATDIIQLDLPSRGYIVPESMYIRYKIVTTGHAGATSIRGTPVYTPFQKLETLIGSQVVESINNYGQLCNMIVNLKMNNSSKNGMAASLGYADNATAASVNLTNINCNGRLLAATPDTSFLAGPLGCIISNADKLVPLKFMPACRIQLTIDSLANIYYAATTTPTSLAITNFELCFDLVDFPAEVDAAVASMADANGKLFIKSQSYLSSGQSLPQNSVGTLEFIYNMRLASIKSLFLQNYGTSLNRGYDAYDVTGAAGGDYQFFIASLPYPQRPLSTIQNKAGVLTELLSAFGPAHDLISSQCGISPSNAFVQLGTATTVAAPAYFFVGTNTERLSTNAVMLSGVSSQNSPISVRINIGTSTGANTCVTQLTALYDAVFEIDIANKQVAILQ